MNRDWHQLSLYFPLVSMSGLWVGGRGGKRLPSASPVTFFPAYFYCYLYHHHFLKLKCLIKLAVKDWGLNLTQALSACTSLDILTKLPYVFSLKKKWGDKVRAHFLGLLAYLCWVTSHCLQPHRLDCSLPVSSAHGIFQARILEWVALSYSRGSSQPRD